MECSEMICLDRILTESMQIVILSSSNLFIISILVPQYGQSKSLPFGWVKTKMFYFISTFTHIHQIRIFLFMVIVSMKLANKLKRNCLEKWLSQIVSIFKIFSQFIHKNKWKLSISMIAILNKGVQEYLCTNYSISFILIQFNAVCLGQLNSIKYRIVKYSNIFQQEITFKKINFKSTIWNNIAPIAID